MNPDRLNYEIWIADWLAGNLNSDQIKLFKEFLELNPDLKDEAESISITILSPGNKTFNQKDLLKKSAGDLHPSQVEYFSVAYLENDISSEQLGDLNICIDTNPELRAVYESVKRIKLVPPVINYRFKKRLIKQTMTGKILRLVYTGLSAAASIAVLVMISHLISRHNIKNDKLTNGNEISVAEPVILYGQVIIESENMQPSSGTDKDIENIMPAKSNFTEPEKQPEAVSDHNISTTDFRITAIQDYDYLKITKFPEFHISLLQEPADHSLVASYIPYQEPIYDDRNGLTRFLARTFREKILREDTGSDAPVRPYEIASAGINGISRFFGLDMALVSITDEQGELKSVYFSSRLLKINAPVKKDESLQ